MEKINVNKFWKRIIILCLALLVIPVLVVTLFDDSKESNPAIIEGGKITRTYEQIFTCLDEAPQDITKQRYESHIPSIIQKDIEIMMESEENVEIRYTSSNMSYIRIYKDESFPSGIRIEINGIRNGIHSFWYVNDFFSFYKTKDCIVIYGTDVGRNLDGYTINVKTFEHDYISLGTDITVDLLGVNREFDTIRAFCKNATLCKNGNEFMIYRLGEQLGETVTFPGEKIVDFSYSYVLDEHNDLYYLYYSTNTEYPWIHFVLVDKNISQINDNESLQTDKGISYPYYEKKGKKYVGVTNYDLEKSYGQSWGCHNDEIAASNINFNVEIVEISKPLASRIVLGKVEVGELSLSKANKYDWYLRYYYEANGQEVYEEERINGLDSELSEKFLEGDIAKFDGKEVTIEEISDVISQLKELYSSYEDEACYYE